jgi:FAD/FMN-containing dehydrogenase
MTNKVINKEKADIGQELNRAIGAGKVKDDELVCASYSHDVSVISFRQPAFVILPENKGDVVGVMKIANQHRFQ